LGNDLSNAYAAKNISPAVSNAWTGIASDVQLMTDNKQIMTDLAATGATVFAQSLRFSNLGNRTQADENVGAKLFNENGIISNIKALTPAMALGSDLYFDWYPASTTLYPGGYVDITHLTTAEGYSVYRNWLLDSFAARILGLPPVKTPKSFSVARTPRPFRMMSTADGAYNALVASMYNTSGFQYNPPVAQNMLSLDGLTMNSIVLTGNANGTVGQSDNTTTSNTGNTSESLINDSVKRYCWYIQPGQGIVAIATMSGFNANQYFDFKYVSCRNVSVATTGRTIEISTDNFATVASSANGAVITGSEPTINTVRLRADASGNCTIYARCQSGSTFGYLNGYEVWPV
jgi:hypothetical protein